ncbi:MAG: glycoside hydrolase family 3 N-terminal domain-containing protein [Eubacteriales bacterium]|nr:glycoside hydrolase family 3 N-terminal domain-containing protein [Eubacteriales bacterium]
MYKDASLSPKERAKELLGLMTLEEKCAQLGSIWAYEVVTNDRYDEKKADEKFADGMGQITRLGGCTSLKPQAAARLGNQMQRRLVEGTRLGIPALIHEESCAGYLTAEADVFPQAIGVGASFEPSIAREMGERIREQMLALGAREALAPLLDVTRDPRWGRTEETYGEDPYLCGRMGVNYVSGLQGEDMARGVLATGKHFAGYGASEGGMNWAPAHIAPREMEEVYLAPFEAAVREAHLRAVMPAYHELDGVPCHTNRWLLKEILRDKWGFEGLLVSDYFGVGQVHSYHRAAASRAQAARMSLEAGLDCELPSTDCFGAPLIEAVRAGEVPEALVDESVLRVLETKFALGLFEHPYVDEETVLTHFRGADMRAFALSAARKTITLLKNDGVLPLRGMKRIAVVGPNADDVRNMLGDYSYPAHVESLMDQNDDNFANTPTPDTQRDPAAALPRMDSVLAGLKKRFADAEIVYEKGCGVLDGADEGIARAAALAASADVVIAVVGDKAGLLLDCTSGEARDRATLTLPGRQGELLRAVQGSGRPVVAVLVHGRPYTLPWEDEHLSAVLTAWLPGEEGAQAIAEALAGDFSPAGRLPITFPRAVGQVPVFYAHRPSGGRSNWKIEYVDESNKPLYPFGYGLSYTRFEYSALSVPASTPIDGKLTVSCTVKNTGRMDGDEVVQLYVHDAQADDVTRPVKELKGFLRVALKAGEEKHVSFEVDVRQLAFLNRAMEFVVEPGTLEVLIGASSEDIRLSGATELVGAKRVVKDKVFASRAKAE